MRALKFLAVLVCVSVSCATDAQTLASDGPIVSVSKVYPAPGREDEVQTRLLKLVEFVRKAEPNTVYRLHRSNKEPVVFLGYGVYESQAALENHRNVVLPAFRRDYGPAPEGLFARPEETELYRDISK